VGDLKVAYHWQKPLTPVSAIDQEVGNNSKRFNAGLVVMVALICPFPTGLTKEKVTA